MLGENRGLRPGVRPDASLTTVSGVAVAAAGLSLVAVGAWARREVARTLARERIVSTSDAKPPSAPVRSAAGARSLAEVIRARTIAATGGRTYAETDPYVAADGSTTPDAALALIDERTGAPVENPNHALWVQSTTLQTALTQAYVSFRLASLTMALGGALFAAGLGLASVRPRRG